MSTSSSSPTTAATRCGAASPRSAPSRACGSRWSTTPRPPATRWPRSPTSTWTPCARRATAASRTAATSGSAAARRRSSSSSTQTPGSTPSRCARSSPRWRRTRGAGLVGAAHPRRRRLARVQPAALPPPALDVLEGAVPAPRPAARELDGRAGPRRGGVRARRDRRVGLGRVHARAPRGLRAARRVRRAAVPVLRGHRPLPAALGGRPRGPLRAGGARPPRGRRVVGDRTRPRRSQLAAASTTRASITAAWRRSWSGSASRSTRRRTRSPRSPAPPPAAATWRRCAPARQPR